MADLDDPDGGTWSPEYISRCANEAIEEYARRTESYRDFSNTSEIPAKGSILFKNNPAADVTTLTINAVSVIDAAIVPGATFDQTAVAVRDAINANGVYTAVVNGPVVTITAPVGSGYGANGRVIAVNAGVASSLVLTSFTGGSVLTKLPLVVGTDTYQLDPRIIRVKDGYLETSKRTIFPMSINNFRHHFEATANGAVTSFSVDSKYNKIVFTTKPDVAETIDFNVVRYPVNKISWERPNEIVEIERGYEVVLYPGIMYHAYKKLRNGVPINMALSKVYYAEFAAKIKETQLVSDREMTEEYIRPLVTSGSSRNC
jgi:hypothetical protein